MSGINENTQITQTGIPVGTVGAAIFIQFHKLVAPILTQRANSREWQRGRSGMFPFRPFGARHVHPGPPHHPFQST